MERNKRSRNRAAGIFDKMPLINKNLWVNERCKEALRKRDETRKK